MNRNNVINKCANNALVFNAHIEHVKTKTIRHMEMGTWWKKLYLIEDTERILHLTNQNVLTM